MIFEIDWQGIFVPTVPVLEIFIRGSLLYLALFLLIRLTLRRVGGTFDLADILMVALIAAAAQNAMAREHHSVTDGLILIVTIVFWGYMLDWLGHRFPRFQRFYNPPPLPLVRDGRMLRHNMRLQLITEDELMSQLRRYRIEDLMEVKEARMEADGSITVTKKRKRKSRKRSNP
jgi:uncharacterized membrane protein YcaP (DUF421 family)